MSGQRNLTEVLKSLQISCDNIEYGFGTIKTNAIELTSEILGTFKETEGLTVIAQKEYLEKNNIHHEGIYAKLTIEVHTSLELVGLTAVLAKQLGENNISANVIAGYFHDHIFVQYDLREKAIVALNHLKEHKQA